jgi:hypothetical protein
MFSQLFCLHIRFVVFTLFLRPRQNILNQLQWTLLHKTKVILSSLLVSSVSLVSLFYFLFVFVSDLIRSKIFLFLVWILVLCE